jgi:chromosomal replication initiator protein
LAEANGTDVAGAKNPWDLAQTKLREVIDEHSYKNWFTHTRFESFEKGRLTVGVPSQFSADWLKKHYLDTITDCVRVFEPAFEELRLVVSVDAGDPPQDSKTPPMARRRSEAKPAPKRNFEGFNPRYTFDRFVIGSGNRFAHAAARAVAENPARAYNPLFLYGATGLGKTHLLQAIGHDIIHRSPNKTVMFISSEKFTNQLIESIATKNTAAFRNKYRRVDVLLIDDIHFIAGRDATQEEFFHTFNALYDDRKQVIISSDRQPKEIRGLEERLVSRFEWGLVTDVQPPDLETRIAILQNKAIEERLTASHDVLRCIATYVTTNIRELEGALITILAYARLTSREISTELAEEVLRDLIGRDKIKPITIQTVQRIVAEHFDVRIADLRGRSKTRQIAYPRQIAMYLCKRLMPNVSLAEVGEAFGGKDHSTVLHARRKIAAEVKNNRDTAQILKHLERLIQTSE